MERVNVINNSGRIDNLIVNMDEITNEKRPPTTTDKSKETNALSDKASKQNSISCSFTYLKSGQRAPRLDAPELSLTSTNPILRIYNKIAKLNDLQRELNQQPSLPVMQSRPLSMHLECPSEVGERDALQKMEKDLDKNLMRLEQLLGNNATEKKLAFAKP
jgi:hypothetical protein